MNHSQRSLAEEPTDWLVERREFYRDFITRQAGKKGFDVTPFALLVGEIGNELHRRKQAGEPQVGNHPTKWPGYMLDGRPAFIGLEV